MGWLKRRVIDRLRMLLRQGISADRLAACAAIGVTVGIVPILGVSSALCAVLALAFNLNLPTMQIVQTLLAPVQLVLIIPFVRLGEWMMHDAPEPLSIGAGLALIHQGAWHAVHVLRYAILHAGLAWLVLAPFVTLISFYVLRAVFQRAAAVLPLRAGARASRDT